MKDTTVPLRRIHIVGRRNTGKTTLVCELIQELTHRGLRVATIKHTHHQHELDTPGKDSWKHRQAGAVGVGILSGGLAAMYVPLNSVPLTATETVVDKYAVFDGLLGTSDIVLVEGDLHTLQPRVEVWRNTVNEPPYAVTDPGISIVVTDDACDQLGCEVLARSSLATIADAILRLSGRIP